MPRNFRELEVQMAPERLARAEVKAKEIMVDMLLAEMFASVSSGGAPGKIFLHRDSPALSPSSLPSNPIIFVSALSSIPLPFPISSIHPNHPTNHPQVFLSSDI